MEQLGRAARVLFVLGLLGACTSAENVEPSCAEGGKCDLPNDPAEVSCSRRRSDAFNPNRLSYAGEYLRWSCADVSGVTADDRGQEYCEYFAIAKLPYDNTPRVLGRNLGIDSRAGTTPGSVALTPTDIADLEADPDKVVGQCVFTSWNSDNQSPILSTSIFGVPLDDDNFRMKFDVNSAEAALELVKDCYTNPSGGDPDNPRDLLHDDFTRGCMWNADLNGTEYRKSDSTICALVTRAHECGCAPAEGVDVAKALFERRGFQLGSWTGFVEGNEAATRLPPNCRYVNAGDNSQTLVTCDLNATDLLSGAADVRSYCQEKYADNIVVHVSIPTTQLVCDSSTSSSEYAGTCSATPWVLTDRPEY